MKEIKKQQGNKTYFVSLNNQSLTITQDHNVPEGVLLRVKNKNLNLNTKKYDMVELGVYPNYLYFNCEGVEVSTPIRWVENVMKNTHIIINNYVVSYNVCKKENGGFYYDVELNKVKFNSHKEREDLM